MGKFTMATPSSGRAVFFRAARAVSFMAVGSVTLLCMGFPGCPGQSQQEGAFYSGVVQGIRSAEHDYNSNGEGCGTVQPVLPGADGTRRSLTNQEKQIVGCRVGFSSFRLGQMIAEQSREVTLCSRLPERVNRAITQAYGLPTLTAPISERVVGTCRDGFGHPRPAGNTVALQTILGLEPDLADIFDESSNPSVNRVTPAAPAGF